MSKKNKIALIFIAVGLVSSIILSVVLPGEKLVIALTGSNALIGAGLTQWTSNKED